MSWLGWPVAEHLQRFLHLFGIWCDDLARSRAPCSSSEAVKTKTRAGRDPSPLESICNYIYPAWRADICTRHYHAWFRISLFCCRMDTLRSRRDDGIAAQLESAQTLAAARPSIDSHDDRRRFSHVPHSRYFLACDLVRGNGLGEGV